MNSQDPKQTEQEFRLPTSEERQQGYENLGQLAGKLAALMREGLSKEEARKRLLPMAQIFVSGRQMIKEPDLPKVFDELLAAVNSIVEEYNNSRSIKLDVYSQPYLRIKVRRNHLPNGISLTVQLTPYFEFDVEHWSLASADSESKTEVKKLYPMLQRDNELRFKYENGEPMTTQETAQSLMQPFFDC